MSTIKVTNVNPPTAGNPVNINGLAYPSAGPLSNRNLIINGAMQVAQRGTQTTGVTSSGYVVDRLNYLTAIGTWTIDQSTDSPTGFSNSAKITCTTANASPAANAYVILEYHVEAQDLQQLDYGASTAKALTLSFWVKSNKTGTVSFEIQQPDNSYRQYAASYSISSADTWEPITISIPADTAGVINNDNGSGLRLRWWLNSGSDYQGGSASTAWATTSQSNSNFANLGLGGATSDYFAITGVQLEVGQVATPFEHRSYGDELNRCIRYFRKHQSVIGSAGGYTDLIMTTVTFDPPMRTGPSIDVTGAIQITAPGVANYNQSSAGVTQSNYTTAHGIFFYLPNYSGLTNHRIYIWNDSTDTLTFSAEL